VRALVTVIACGLALVSTGCGVGLGPGSVDGEVGLSVTRDYGRTPVAGPVEHELGASDTVMRLLDRTTEVETSYGGRFVDAIDGIETTVSPRNRDWFYFVNGIAAEIGAAEFDLSSGDSVWWDYRDWTAAMEVGAVTGSYPAPLASGSVGAGSRASLSCRAPESICDLARGQLSDDGVQFARSDAGEVRVEVGSFGDLEDSGLDSDPAESGVFARFAGSPGGEATLELLDQNGATADVLGPGSGLIAAVREPGGPPVWIVTGTDDEGVETATAALEPEVLGSTYAVAITPEGIPVPVPVPTDDSGKGGGN
jgi:hypothetical protein